LYRLRSAFFLIGLVLFVPATTPNRNSPRNSDVRWVGALREILHEGRLEGRAPIAVALQRRHAYALGALAHLDGEFIVLDGRVHQSRPDGGRVRSMTSNTGRDSAALMVFAHVPAWHSMPLHEAVPLAALADTVLARAAALGLPPTDRCRS
jgi:hypothetical protein